MSASRGSEEIGGRTTVAPARAASSRRSFLKSIGGAVGAAALPLGSGAARSAEGSRDPDVIVIGGGFAGITAARELQHAGLRTLILEARNRLGGRTFTVHVDGELFELGGTWVHSTQPHVFAELNRYGVELVETNAGIPEKVIWWDGERAKEAGFGEIMALLGEAMCASSDEEIDAPLSSLQALALLSSLMDGFHAGAAVAFPRPFDPFFSDAWKQADTLSVRERLDQLDLSADRLGLLEGVLGASAHGNFDEAGLVEMLRWWALSGNDLQRYSDSVARYRLRDGTISLIEAMHEDGGAELRLGTPVASVAQNGEGVEVRTEQGERIRARAVIAALPMNVLANIRFEPALHADKLAASRARHAGAGIKAYIKVGKDLPPTAIFAGESEPFCSIFTMAGGGHARELVAFGTDPGRIAVHDRASVEKELQRFLPDVEVKSVLAWDWHLDPHSLGTWCVLRKGQMTRYLEALREPHGLVHFAGGDFALGWRGFIDGAIESGTRVARQLVEQLHGSAEPPDLAAFIRSPHKLG
jgi:monoamine oxidase